MILGQQNAQNMRRYITKKAKRKENITALNDLNLDLFTSLERDFLTEELLTETYYEMNRTKLRKQENSIFKITEQTERTKQYLKVEDVNNF